MGTKIWMEKSTENEELEGFFEEDYIYDNEEFEM